MKIPGFIDLQVNGYKGVDFSSLDLTEKSFAHACRELLQKGSAGFLPAIITSLSEVYEHNLQIISKVAEHSEFQNKILGIHLEGPFISSEPGAIGAHNPDRVRKPDKKFLDQLWEWAQGKIKILTIAGDAKGADEITRHAVSLGITVSLGHHLALEKDLDYLVQHGALALTHLGNGIPNMLPRHPNPIWAGLANDNLTAMIITDGHHLPPSVIKTIIRAKGISKVIGVSDSSAVTGLPPGKYVLHGNEAILEDSGLFHNPQRGCLVGSSATMLDCMNYLASLKFLKLEDLLQIGFFNPLQLISVQPDSIKSDFSIHFDKNKGRFIIGKKN